MRNHSSLFGISVVLACVSILWSCAPAEPPSSTSPVGFQKLETASVAPSSGLIDPVFVIPAEAAAMTPQDTGSQRSAGHRLEGPLSEEEISRLQDEAMDAPFNELIQAAAVTGPLAPILGIIFESLDFVTAGSNFVPPDPELAVGPGHTISVVNDYLLITDPVGTPLVPPIQFANFFTGVSGCSGLFDPNVLYDEQLDRFVAGIDANGTAYCVAMSQGPDPTLGWVLYSFATVPASATPDFFDYPHAGVGQDAIYMGANIFNNALNAFLRAEVWAMDKAVMAAGLPLPMPIKQTVANGFTPQPMNAHGWLQGTWPIAQQHTILANAYSPGYSGDIFDVWAWSDPFGANVFGPVGSVDLAIATGVAATYPIDAPQIGGLNIQANDWRVLDCEYRNGDVWMTQTISCNPGMGTVDCIRWAEIDPVTPTVLQAGVFATDDEFRVFPDAGVNHCDDMTIGYTKTSMMMSPAVWVTGRLGIDPSGVLQPEAMLRPGDQPYVSWDGPPHRWGDYTGGTSDPDGVRTWYLGEYSKAFTTPPLANWGTFVGEFFTDCAVDLVVGKTNGVTQVAPGGQVTYTITVTNTGRGDAFGAVITDTFPAALTGVTWSCSGQAGPPTAVCSTSSGMGNINLTADLEVNSTITITATGTLSASATGTLVNTASVVYAGVYDPVPADNSATDTDTILPAADLAVSKVDGQASAVPGTPVTYTVVVSNLGPLNAVGAQVTDTLPAILGNVVWTCQDQIGPPASICINPAGAGNISELVDIDVGAAVIFTITGDIDPGATGSLSNTASVVPPMGTVDPISGNDSATDTDTLTPEADLDVGVTDGSCYVLPGGSLTYTVTVDNLGPSHAPASSISDTVPVELTITSWTCAASGSAVCGSASGSGPLTDSPSISSGDGVTYSVSGTVSGSASGWLVYTVNAAPGVGVVDPNGGNDSDLDRNALETPIFCDGFEMGTTGGWSGTTP